MEKKPHSCDAPPAQSLSPAELNDRYEQLRRSVTEGPEAPSDGLAVLRHRGLHDWIAHISAASRPWPRPPAAAASPMLPAVSAAARSPLICLCTDLLIANLIPKEEVS